MPRTSPLQPPARPSATVEVVVEPGPMAGDLTVPEGARGLVIFAHGSGSRSPRSRTLASELRTARLATLLLDLLTPVEETADAPNGELAVDVTLLAERVVAAIAWAKARHETRDLRVGLFGASTGAAAALVAAAL